MTLALLQVAVNTTKWQQVVNSVLSKCDIDVSITDMHTFEVKDRHNREESLMNFCFVHSQINSVTDWVQKLAQESFSYLVSLPTLYEQRCYCLFGS